MLQVRKLNVMQGHTGSVYTLAADSLRPDIFYSAGGDGMVVEWSENDPDNGRLAAKVDSNIFSMLALPEKGLMLLGQMQGGIHVLDLLKKEEIKHLSLNKKGVFDLLLQRDKAQFFAAGGDGVISSWTVNKQELLKQVKVSDQSIRCLAMHPTLPLLAAGCSDNRVYLLDSETLIAQHPPLIAHHTNSVFSAVFSPDGKWLLTGSRDAQLVVWNVEKNCEFYREIPAHLFTINSIVYSPDGSLFATASRDKTLKIWDASDFSLLKVIAKEKMDGHVNSVNKVIWPNRLISCSDDRSVMTWEVIK